VCRLSTMVYSTPSNRPHLTPAAHYSRTSASDPSPQDARTVWIVGYSNDYVAFPNSLNQNPLAKPRVHSARPHLAAPVLSSLVLISVAPSVRGMTKPGDVDINTRVRAIQGRWLPATTTIPQPILLALLLPLVMLFGWCSTTRSPLAVALRPTMVPITSLFGRITPCPWQRCHWATLLRIP